MPTLSEGESSLEERRLVPGLGGVHQCQELLHQVVDLEGGADLHPRQPHHLILGQRQQLGAVNVLVREKDSFVRSAL